RVGVFVNEEVDRLTEIASTTRLTGVQLHGNELADYAHEASQKTGLKIIQTALKRPLEPLSSPSGSHGVWWDIGQKNDVFAVLIASQPSHGGTGTAWDWRKGAEAIQAFQRRGHRAIVAGGLTPENVGEAIRILHPWGVDVVTGVESSPG